MNQIAAWLGALFLACNWQWGTSSSEWTNLGASLLNKVMKFSWTSSHPARSGKRNVETNSCSTHTPLMHRWIGWYYLQAVVNNFLWTCIQLGVHGCQSSPISRTWKWVLKPNLDPHSLMWLAEQCAAALISAFLRRRLLQRLPCKYGSLCHIMTRFSWNRNGATQGVRLSLLFGQKRKESSVLTKCLSALLQGRFQWHILSIFSSCFELISTETHSYLWIELHHKEGALLFGGQLTKCWHMF